MVNYRIHRVGFVPYIPQAIHCLAVEDVSLPRIAVSRADGSIEIWNIEDNWFLERKMCGSKETSIEALVWSGSRLFSSGLHGEITEWDLNKLSPKVSVDSYGGAVWSLGINLEQSLMAAGCEDGCVRLFDITSEDLDYARVFNKQEGRILSLCWHKDGQVLVAGGSDGTIRVYEVSTGHARLCITLDNSPGRKILVWSVVITSDFTIISGDSSGKTQVWDGKLGTLIKGFSVHIADVLAVCINQQEDTMYSSGVDNKLMQFKLLTDKEGNKAWCRSNSTRAHSHDIRALVMVKNIDAKDSLLVSAGVDTSIIIYSEAKYGKSKPRKIPAYPMTSEIHLSSQRQTLMFQKTTSLHFWKLGKPVNKENCHLEEHPSHLLQIETKGPSHIVCSAVSDDCVWTAYSDVHRISFFKLNLENARASSPVEKMKCLAENILPAHHMKFTKDGSRLLTVTNAKSLQIIRLDAESTTVDTIVFPRSDTGIHQRNLDPYSPVTVLSVSPDGKFCACSDTSGFIHVFDVSVAKHKCVLPRFSRQVTAMTFQRDTNILALVTTKKEVFMFDIKTMKMTEWSKMAAKSGFPKQWQKMPTKVVSMMFDTRCNDVIILQSHDGFVLIDTTKLGIRKSELRSSVALWAVEKENDTLEKEYMKYFEEGAPLPSENIKLFQTKRDHFKAKVGKKRKHDEAATETGEQELERCEAFKVCNKYQPLLFLGLNEDNSLVAVERSWSSILECLPPTLHRKRYGT